MSYVNLTEYSIGCVKRIDEQLVRSEKTNFMKKHIVSRLVYAALLPVALVTNICDVALGIFGFLGVILTVGRNQAVANFALNHLDSFKRLTLTPYLHVLKMINPSMKDTFDEFSWKISDLNVPNGLQPRAIHVSIVIAKPIVCSFFAAVGAISTPFSILTLGLVESLNELALGSWQGAGQSLNIFRNVIGWINPDLIDNHECEMNEEEIEVA